MTIGQLSICCFIDKKNVFAAKKTKFNESKNYILNQKVSEWTKIEKPSNEHRDTNHYSTITGIQIQIYKQAIVHQLDLMVGDNGQNRL